MEIFSDNDICEMLDDVGSFSSSSSSTSIEEFLNSCLQAEIIKDHYEEIEFIDKGGCGAVYKARHKVDKKRYALKFICIDKEPGKDVLLREARILSEINNENVIRYFTSYLISPSANQCLKVDTDDDDSSIAFKSDSSAYGPMFSDRLRNNTDCSSNSDSEQTSDNSSNSDDIQKISSRSSSACPKSNQLGECLVIKMELCNCSKNLKHIIEDKAALLFKNPNFRQNTIKGILNGLRCIHDEGIMHRDLKPANIFFDDKDTVKIGDFGFSQHYIITTTEDHPDDSPSKTQHKDFTNKLGTFPYMAPEVDDKKGRYDKRVDIYSLGVILFEMYYPMNSGSERVEVLTNLRKPTVEFPDDFEEKVGMPHIKEVLQSLLDHGPSKRYPIESLEKMLMKKEPKKMVTVNNMQPQEQGDAPPAMYRQTSKRPSLRRQQSEPNPANLGDAGFRYSQNESGISISEASNVVQQQQQQPVSDAVQQQQQPVNSSNIASDVVQQQRQPVNSSNIASDAIQQRQPVNSSNIASDVVQQRQPVNSSNIASDVVQPQQETVSSIDASNVGEQVPLTTQNTCMQAEFPDHLRKELANIQLHSRKDMMIDDDDDDDDDA